MFSTPVENLWIKGDIDFWSILQKRMKSFVTQEKTIVESFSVLLVEKLRIFRFFGRFLSYPRGKACG